MKLFITDFDGVICDSAWESLLSAFNAYNQLQNPGCPRLKSLETLSEEVQQKFRRLRAYLHGAEDFLPLMKASLSSAEVNSEKAFLSFHDPSPERTKKIQNLFYAERDYLRLRERETWLALNPVFPGMDKQFMRLSPYDNVYILTTKRKQDVMDILQHYGINFPSEHIRAVQTSMKYESLMEIIDTTANTPENTIYIEDQFNFLPPAQKSGCTVYLAGWGYVSPEHFAAAESQHIPVIDVKEYGSIIREF